MSFNSSSSNATGIRDFAGAIVSAYAEQTIPILTLLVLYAVLGAICLSLLPAVFHLSTPRVRRTPLFVTVTFDILLGVAISCWMVTNTVRQIFSLYKVR
jgi:hypothetical protein